MSEKKREETVRAMHLKCGSASRECETLSSLRDLLLPKLMSGQIRIKDAAKIAEAAL
jgi:type I restriction enzyme S subunit